MGTRKERWVGYSFIFSVKNLSSFSLTTIRCHFNLQLPDYAVTDFYLSISPSTISMLPIAATTSAISRPEHIGSSACKLANDGERIWTRYGLAVPSLAT